MGLLSKWVESLDYQYEILPSCSRQKSPRSTCTGCIDACAETAISLEKGIPVIEEEKCTECGECIVACPVQAVAGIFPKREIYQSQFIAKTDEIPSVKELLVYAKKGLKGIVSEEELSVRWMDIMNETNEILSMLDQPPLQIQVKKIEKYEETYTRRELFFSWKKDTESLMKEMAPAKWRFNQKDLELSKYYPNHQFAEIHLNAEKCTLCTACEALCDKRCLQINEEGFLISAQACSACRLCEDICPEKAISIHETIAPYKELSFDFHIKECQTCGESFRALTSNAEQCLPCVKRAQFAYLSN